VGQALRKGALVPLEVAEEVPVDFRSASSREDGVEIPTHGRFVGFGVEDVGHRRSLQGTNPSVFEIPVPSFSLPAANSCRGRGTNSGLGRRILVV